MESKRIRGQRGASIVDYVVLVAFVTATVAASARLLGYHTACIFGAATYGFERSDRSAAELRKHVPGDYSGGEAYGQCGSIN